MYVSMYIYIENVCMYALYIFYMYVVSIDVLYLFINPSIYQSVYLFVYLSHPRVHRHGKDPRQRRHCPRQ